MTMNTLAIVQELKQDPELFKSFYLISIESFSLLVDRVRPQVGGGGGDDKCV
jgi:hypothetical protein